jgi:hypothetical protein
MPFHLRIDLFDRWVELAHAACVVRERLGLARDAAARHWPPSGTSLSALGHPSI